MIFTRKLLGHLLITVVCVFSNVVVADDVVVSKPRPNFVVIIVDDLGCTDLGVYGSRFYETPRLDALASEGVRFTQSYAACAVCSPTRAALQTGQEPARTGVTDWIRSKFQGGNIPDDGKNPTRYIGSPEQEVLCPPNKLFLEHEFLTIAEHLRNAGYATGHIGKWHLGQEQHTPTTQGYDVNIAGCDLGQPPSYFDPYEAASGTPYYTIPKEVLPPRSNGEYLTDRESDEAARFIRTHKDKPFFLHLAHYAVHTPLQAKPELVEKYRNKREQMQRAGTETEHKNAVYAAMIESVDNAVGKVIDTLRAERLADNTYIIFTSDNGGLIGSTSNAPWRDGKGSPYEGGIRVPLLVWGPGRVTASVVVDVPVITHDIFPTLCDWAGVALPATPLDGLSFRSATNNDTKGVAAQLTERPLYWHFPHYRTTVPYSIVRHNDWKLIRFYGTADTFELYQLAADPSETANVADTQQEVVTRLTTMLDTHLDAMGAKRIKRKEFGHAPL